VYRHYGFGEQTVQTDDWSFSRYKIVQTIDAYLKLAARAQQAADRAQDPKAKRLLQSSAQRWLQLAEVVARRGRRSEIHDKDRAD
jgi:hypothetical protein